MRTVQSYKFWFGRFADDVQVGFVENIKNPDSFVIRPLKGGWSSENHQSDCPSGTAAGGWWVSSRRTERPATKEEIQTWIDTWGVPKTFKGQPEYPLKGKAAKKLDPLETELARAQEKVKGLEELKEAKLELASTSSKASELRRKVKELTKKYMPRNKQ